MPRTTEIWSEEAALTACCEMVRACIADLDFEAVYQGDLDLTMMRPSCRVYAVSEPIERAWQDERWLVKQQQVWLVRVAAVAPGQLYTTNVLGAAADYTAQPGDDAEAIRDGQLLALAGLGKPIALAAVDDDALRLTGDVAGQHLAVSVTPNLVAEIEMDNLHDAGLMPSFWTVRFEFEEQPGVSGSESRAPAWATRLRGWLQANLSADVLHAAHIDFNQIIARGGFRRPDRGKTTEVAWIDVQFSAVQGLGFDTPSIESFGAAPPVEVQHGNS